ncbi:hypothetical protein L208DRAFT_1121217, partial [Tricholoma matsutake]
LEGVTIKLVILAMRVMGIHDADVLIWSDNKGVIGAFSKGCCFNFMTNLSIHCSDKVYSEVGISATLIYINPHLIVLLPFSMMLMFRHRLPPSMP